MKPESEKGRDNVVVCCWNLIVQRSDLNTISEERKQSYRANLLEPNQRVQKPLLEINQQRNVQIAAITVKTLTKVHPHIYSLIVVLQLGHKVQSMATGQKRELSPVIV